MPDEILLNTTVFMQFNLEPATFQTRSAWSTDKRSTGKSSAVHNSAGLIISDTLILKNRSVHSANKDTDLLWMNTDG